MFKIGDMVKIEERKHMNMPAIFGVVTEISEDNKYTVLWLNHFIEHFIINGYNETQLVKVS